MDGSMIPIVATQSTTSKSEKIDRRKTRTVGWREARLCLARGQNSSQPTFGVTLGTVDEAGNQLADSAIRAGLGTETSVQGVGDGAPWIANQVNRIFGAEATYLIDFYHLCDYERCLSVPLVRLRPPNLGSSSKNEDLNATKLRPC